MNKEQILKQSQAAYNQWCVQWREHAKIHSKYEMKSLLDFENIGIGKAILLCANGYSLEENIETIKENQNKVDILCCDKSLGTLLDNGITPTYCLVCDANVDYEKYLKPWENKLNKIKLIINVCANPTWTEKGNWESKYFFINKDILTSELEFSNISGCKNFIPAGTNVSNAMLVLLTQCDNDGKRNFFGYDKYLLIGYDYSWKHNGKYYAFNETGDGKSEYMKHIYCINMHGEFAYSSGNLAFSADWLSTYINTFKLYVVNCSKDTILQSTKFGKLSEQMNYLYKREDSTRVRFAVEKLRYIMDMKNKLEKELHAIGKDHALNSMASI